MVNDRRKRLSRTQKTFALLACLAVLLGIYQFISANQKNDENADDAAAVTVISIDTSSISELTWSYEGESYTLEKLEEYEEAAVDETEASAESEESASSSGVWIWRNHEDVKLDQAAVEAMLVSISDISASAKIKNVTNFAQYGLASPESEVTFTVQGGVVNEDGTLTMSSSESGNEADSNSVETSVAVTVTLYTGNYTDITGEYYAMLAGSDTVFTVSGDYMYDFSLDAADLE